MKKKGYLIWMILLYGWSAFAQRGASFTKKNSVSFFYTPMYAKTNFTNLDAIITTGEIRQLYETELPNLGIYGYAYGIRYQRMVTNKWGVNIGAAYMLSGQRSPRFYSINGVSDNVLDNLPDYGGTLYKINYESYESFLSVEYKLKTKNKIQYFIQLGGLLNIYHRVHLDRYIMSRDSGERTPSSSVTYFQVSGSLKKVLQRYLELNLWRLGMSLGAGITYEPWPFFSLSASPEFRYYGNLKDTSRASTIVEGGIYSIGVALSTQLKF